MKTSKMYPAYFLIGSLLLFGVLYLLPSILGIGYSFTDWSAYSDEVNFLGFGRMFDNYLKAFSDEKYMGYMGNTLLFTFVTTIVKDVIGLALAVLLIRRIKLLNFHRAVLFIPAVLSALIVAAVAHKSGYCVLVCHGCRHMEGHGLYHDYIHCWTHVHISCVL